MFSEGQLAFMQRQRAGRLATADVDGAPHVIPVCYACDGQSVYIALDAKPKRVATRRLKRVRNILENSRVALAIDHYDDDWDALAYVLIRGTAEIIDPDAPEHEQAIVLLRQRYAQYQTMAIDEEPVIALRPASVVAWGAIGERSGT